MLTEPLPWAMFVCGIGVMFVGLSMLAPPTVPDLVDDDAPDAQPPSWASILSPGDAYALSPTIEPPTPPAALAIDGAAGGLSEVSLRRS